ncbi:MAG TPA: hypothetical protein VFF23_00125 [Hanamia sp.]|nr:hypothetical protein [Hanamia sp.]
MAPSHFEKKDARFISGNEHCGFPYNINLTTAALLRGPDKRLFDEVNDLVPKRTPDKE